jgi:hypothetical protein
VTKVQKLRNAIREYENDRWRIISTKVGHGFSPAACKDKATEFSGLGVSGIETSDLKLDGEQQSVGDNDQNTGFDVSSLPRESTSSSENAPTGSYQ